MMMWQRGQSHGAVTVSHPSAMLLLLICLHLANGLSLAPPRPALAPRLPAPLTEAEFRASCARDRRVQHDALLCCSGKIFHRQGRLDACCCKTAYDSRAQICCNGTLSDRAVGKHQLCCGGKSIDGIKFTCCGDVPTRRKPGTACCGSQSYYVSKSQCCGGQVVPLVEGARCCGKQSYLPKSELCCNGKVAKKTSNDSKCCGALVYSPGRQLCCDGVCLNLSRHEYQCCGTSAYRQATEQCAYDPAYKSWKVMAKADGKARCASLTYDVKTQQCALTNGTYTVSNRTTSLFLLSREDKITRPKNDFYKAVEDCKALSNDLNLKKLVHPSVAEYCDVRNECTGNELGRLGLGHWFLSINTCCKGKPLLTPWKKKRYENVECCGNRFYPPLLGLLLGRPQALCCAGKPVMDLKRKCCGAGSYDPETESCCSGRVHAGAGQACCGPDTYDQDKSLCCPHGHEPYIIPKQSKNHTKCCHLKSYNPEHNSCCGFELNKPNFGCCDGWNPYAFRDRICCDYKLFSRVVDGKPAPSVKCCGAKTYNTARGERCCGSEIMIARTEKSHSADYWKWWWSHNMGKIQMAPRTFRAAMEEMQTRQMSLADELDELNARARAAMAASAAGNYTLSPAAKNAAVVGKSVSKVNNGSTAANKNDKTGKYWAQVVAHARTVAQRKAKRMAAQLKAANKRKGKPKAAKKAKGKPKAANKRKGKPKAANKRKGKSKAANKRKGKPKAANKRKGKSKAANKRKGKPKAAKKAKGKPKAAKKRKGKPKAANKRKGKPKAANKRKGKPKAAKKGTGKPKAAQKGKGKPKAAKKGKGKPKVGIRKWARWLRHRRWWRRIPKHWWGFMNKKTQKSLHNAKLQITNAKLKLIQAKERLMKSKIQFLKLRQTTPKKVKWKKKRKPKRKVRKARHNVKKLKKKVKGKTRQLAKAEQQLAKATQKLKQSKRPKRKPEKSIGKKKEVTAASAANPDPTQYDPAAADVNVPSDVTTDASDVTNTAADASDGAESEKSAEFGDSLSDIDNLLMNMKQEIEAINKIESKPPKPPKATLQKDANGFWKI